MSRKKQQPDDEPIDVDTVRADDELIEDLRDGAEPPTGDQVAGMLGAWRDAVRPGEGPL